MARVLAIDTERQQPGLLRQFGDQLIGHELDIVDSWAEAGEYIDVRVPDLVVVALEIAASEADALGDQLAARIKGHRRDILPDDAFARLPVSMRAAPRWFYWIRPPETSATAARAGAHRFVDEIRQYLEFTAKASMAPPELAREWSEPVRDPLPPPIEYAAPPPPPPPPVVEGPAPPPAMPEPVVIPMARPERLPPPPPMSVPLATPVRAREERKPFPIAEYVAMVSQWAIPVAGVVVLGAAVVYGARWYSSRPAAQQVSASVEPAPVAPPKRVPVAMRKGHGSLRVTSAPDGAAVMLDGKKRGTTPIEIADLPIGAHSLTVESSAGTVRSSVEIKSNEMAVVDASIFPGWLALFSPIELQVSEHGRVIVFDEKSQAMLPPGHHDLTIANAALGFREVRSVELKPGETTPVSITLPKTTLTITAVPGASVSIDGAPVGQTPLVEFPVDLGTREIVLNNPQYGERKITVTATVKPVKVDVDLTKPGL